VRGRVRQLLADNGRQVSKIPLENLVIFDGPNGHRAENCISAR